MVARFKFDISRQNLALRLFMAGGPPFKEHCADDCAFYRPTHVFPANGGAGVKNTFTFSHFWNCFMSLHNIDQYRLGAEIALHGDFIRLFNQRMVY